MKSTPFMVNGAMTKFDVKIRKMTVIVWVIKKVCRTQIKLNVFRSLLQLYP